MRVRAAVLERIGADRPYATTRPLTVEEVNEAMDALFAGEVVRQIVRPGL